MRNNVPDGFRNLALSEFRKTRRAKKPFFAADLATHIEKNFGVSAVTALDYARNMLHTYKHNPGPVIYVGQYRWMFAE